MWVQNYHWDRKWTYHALILVQQRYKSEIISKDATTYEAQFDLPPFFGRKEIKILENTEVQYLQRFNPRLHVGAWHYFVLERMK